MDANLLSQCIPQLWLAIVVVPMRSNTGWALKHRSSACSSMMPVCEEIGTPSALRWQQSGIDKGLSFRTNQQMQAEWNTTRLLAASRWV